MKTLLPLLSIVFSWHLCFSQTTAKPIRAGLFTSLYLDSAFDGSGKYTYKNTFPRQAIAGLEYYEGSVLAIDSLNSVGIPVTLEVFDLLSQKGKIKTVLKNGKIDSLDVIFAQVGGNDFLELAEIAKQKNIPLISATYPNDAGIRNSPMIHLANPNITSHLHVVYHQIKKKWPSAKVLVFKGDEAGDGVIEGILDALQEADTASTFPPFLAVKLNKNFGPEDIHRWIDTTKTNVLVSGSLDQQFSTQFARAIAAYDKKGIVQVVGMPNWDGLKEVLSKEYAGVPIYYTTGFFVPKEHAWGISMEERFKFFTGIKPSSSAFKGFELTYYFISLLHKYSALVFNKAEDKKFMVMNGFDFKSVKWLPGAPDADYYENKRIYFIRRLNGVASVQ